jgi:hypothetical protein
VGERKREKAREWDKSRIAKMGKVAIFWEKLGRLNDWPHSIN